MAKLEGLVARLETVVKCEEAKKTEPAVTHPDPQIVDKTALYAEISHKGVNITKDLRPPEEAKGVEEEKKTKKEKKEKKAKKAETEKVARITKSGPNTFYENHSKANLILKAEELTMGDGFYLREAKDSNFEFQGKVRNIFLEKCTSVKLICTVLLCP